MSQQNLRSGSCTKIILAGDGGVGKTAYVERLKSGTFVAKYSCTMGRNVVPVTLETSDGPFRIEMWDTSGQEKIGPLRDGYYEGADAAIIMFDVLSRETLKNVGKWHQDIARVCGEDIPIVIVGNKIDQPNRKVKTKQVQYPRKHKLQYYEVSVKSEQNLEMPILYIAKKLSNNRHLRLIVEDSNMFPADVDEMEIDS